MSPFSSIPNFWRMTVFRWYTVRTPCPETMLISLVEKLAFSKQQVLFCFFQIVQ